MTLTLLNALRVGKLISLFVMLTNWTLWVTLFTSILGFKLSSDPSLTFEKAPNMHAAHHICYTIMIFLTPAVVLIYWNFIHEVHLKNIERDWGHLPELLPHCIMHTYIVHIAPGVCAFILMIISDTVLIRRHSRGLHYFSGFYCFSNFVSAKMKGRPLYWFLTWEDWKSPAICVVLDLVFVVLFYGIALLDEKITGRTAEKKKVKNA